MQIASYPKQIALFFASCVAMLVSLHIVGQVLWNFYDGDFTGSWMVELVHLDRERSIPTLYAYTTLLYCAFLLGIIASLAQRRGQSFVGHWYALAAVFTFLAFDEGLAIHEHFITPTMSWTVPYLLAGLILFLNFVRFLQHLPRRSLHWFLLAATLYVGGAAGLEIPGGQYYHAHGGGGLYDVFITVEEFFEMAGIVVFIYALNDYLSRSFPAAQLRLVMAPEV